MDDRVARIIILSMVVAIALTALMSLKAGSDSIKLFGERIHRHTQEQIGR